MLSNRYRSSRRTWLVAFTVTLLLHALMFLGIRVFRPFTPTPVQARNPEPIDLVFTEPLPEAATPEEPRVFTELPPDRADEAPERADLLSNVTSRARDRVPGGNQALPRMEGESDVPTVALDPTGGSPTPPQPETPDASAAKEPPVDERPAESADDLRGAETKLSPAERSPIVRDPEAVRRDREESLKQLLEPRGGSDIFQPEAAYPQGNAELTGDISLNTTAWDWAPWLQRFRRDLMDHWFAPTAYYMGILKDGGWATIEVKIAPSGEMLGLELLEEQGHPSLTKACVSALDSTAPYEKLPQDFPEDMLVLRIRMVYPKVRTR